MKVLCTWLCSYQSKKAITQLYTRKAKGKSIWRLNQHFTLQNETKNNCFLVLGVLYRICHSCQLFSPNDLVTIDAKLPCLTLLVFLFVYLFITDLLKCVCNPHYHYMLQGAKIAFSIWENEVSIWKSKLRPKWFWDTLGSRIFPHPSIHYLFYTYLYVLDKHRVTGSLE